MANISAATEALLDRGCAVSSRQPAKTHGWMRLSLRSDGERLLTYEPSYVATDHVLGVRKLVKLSVLLDPWVYAWPLTLVVVAISVALLSTSMHLSEDWTRAAEAANDALGVIVAFVIGSFLTMVVSTWNARRAQYVGMSGASRDLLLALGTIVCGTECAIDRAQLGRYVLLACELAYSKARGAMDDDATRADLETRALLRAGEWEAMAAGERHTVVYAWIQARVVQLSRSGVISGHELSLLFEAVSRTRTLAGDLMGSTQRDLPYPYASFVALLVKFHMLAHALARGFELASYTHRGAQGYLLAYFFINMALLQAIVHHHQWLHNPFLDRTLGVAHRGVVMAGLHALRTALMTGDTFNAPPPALE